METGGRYGKVNSRKPYMHGHEESDSFIVPKNPSNKCGDNKPHAEVGEGRRGLMENMEQNGMRRAQSRTKAQSLRNSGAAVKGMSLGLLRVRKVARADKHTRFTSLLHHITPETLRKSYYALKKQAAPGVDGCTWEEYQGNLDEQLEDLHTRVHKGTYRALPSRRVLIPKTDGKLRPLGIAALEDKIAQQAVSEVLTAIYEEDFYGFSYGFRPDRGCHDALNALYVAVEKKKINWVLDADIQRFFDSISHDWMLRFLSRRIADKRVLRLVAKWLKVGVVEGGELLSVNEGTPQGAVISPLLANVYLHYVLDDWVVWWRNKYATGDVIIVRYADDFVMGFQHKHEASLFLEALRDRLNAFALSLHPEKTRLIEFGRFAAENRRKRGERKPETFTFLGFTHICSVNWKDGKYKILRLTDKKRMREKLSRFKAILTAKMHAGIEEAGQWLRRAVQGYYNYFAVPDNMRRLASFRDALGRIWHKILRRRGQKGRMNWDAFNKWAMCWIPRPEVLHPYPSLRFGAKHP
jgi:group II intron reverse transcriptase/maturase